MTCIVGIEDGTDVVLASDSAIGWGADLRDRVRGKCWARDGIGFGTAGVLRAAQLLYYSTIPPQPSGMADTEWLVTRLAPALGTVYEECGDGLDLIVALNGAAYEIDSHLAVLRSPRGYAAIGSGCEVALGALRATRGKSAAARARNAVACAIEHVSTCSLPIEVLRVPSRRQRRRA